LPPKRRSQRVDADARTLASLQPSLDRMSWLSRLFGGRSEKDSRRLDYLNEALTLEKSGDLDAALTSYRLALREKPDDHKILMNMAIAFSRQSRLEEAIRCYKKALDVEPSLPGAHYGLAFLLIKRNEREEAALHLEAFLASPPKSADPANIEHATRALESLRAPQVDEPVAESPDDGQ
jgi:tetratricopeptide (TPR) repeat protein